MLRTSTAVAFLAPLALLASERPWDAKQISQWTQEDAQQVITDSPWAKPATLESDNSSSVMQRGRRGMGRAGGIGLGIPGVGIGMGGPGMGRRGGGYPGGGYPGGGYPQDGRYPDDRYPQDDRYPRDGQDPRGEDRGEGRGDSRRSGGGRDVIVRWESALPVQQAELKIKDSNAPSIDEKHYAIVVAGLPVRLAKDPQVSESRLKSQALLKRDGKKFSKPSDVRILSRDEGLLIVYLFPRSKEIRKNDTQIEFSSKLGRSAVKQTFNPTEMTCQGKLEL